MEKPREAFYKFSLNRCKQCRSAWVSIDREAKRAGAEVKQQVLDIRKNHKDIAQVLMETWIEERAACPPQCKGKARQKPFDFSLFLEASQEAKRAKVPSASPIVLSSAPPSRWCPCLGNFKI